MHHLNRCMLKLQKHKPVKKPLKFLNLLSATENLMATIHQSTLRLTTKPPKTFNIVCPAIIFANNLTDKLTGLLKYEIISIIDIIGNKINGTPLGTNIFKYLKP